MASNERTPAPYRTRHDYLLAFMANVAATSATTVTGRQRGSQGPRPGKPSAGMSGHDLAEQTTCNMRAVGRLIASVTDSESESYSWSLRRLVNVFVDMIHKELPNREQLKQLRSHETSHSYGCPASEVPERWEAFLTELEARINTPDADLERVCAWVEYQIRFEIHPLADGSGRLATALTSWIMLRSGRYIPMYAHLERDEMHRMLRQGLDAFELYYVETCFRERTDGHGTSPFDPFLKREPARGAA